MKKRLFLSFLSLLAALSPLQAAEPTPCVLPLTYFKGHFYIDTTIQDSIPVRIALESGIPYPLIDRRFVEEHPAAFAPDSLKKPLGFRMALGTRYEARTKLAPGLHIGPMRTLSRCYAVDLGKQMCDMILPLQTVATDTTDCPGIFAIDLHRGELHVEPALPDTTAGWSVSALDRDEKSGLYLVRGRLALTNDAGRTYGEERSLIVDLGNANLLALFHAHPEVRAFVRRSRTGFRDGYASSGQRVRALQPAATTFFDAWRFEKRAIVLIDREMKVPGDGFLGARFFEPFSVILDFRGSRMWVAPTGRIEF